MPLTAAERQRRYKQKLKLDPEKYEKYKKKKRANYHNKKRLVNELSPKEKYNARVIWRLRKKNLRRNRKNLENVIAVTPPSSPIMMVPNDPPPVNIEQDNRDQSPVVPRGRKKIRRDRSKLYRENLRLRQEIEELKKKSDKYKKRLYRIDKKKKVERMPDENTKFEELSSAIRDTYQNMKTNKEKNTLKDIFEKVDRSRREDMIQESLGLTCPLRKTLRTRTSATKLRKHIETFFLREDVSRATAGKKETVTKHGEKVQKRFLLDSLKNLHKTFECENPNAKCSYYYFTRNRPFYVVKPTVSGREMCLCKTHINPEYKAKALKNQGVIKTDDMNQLIAATVCNSKLQACMDGTCDQCRDLNIEIDAEKYNAKIQWKEWGRVEELYEKDGKQKKAFKNVKQDKEGTVKELMIDFNKELKQLKKHVYNMKVQFKNFRLAIDNLKETEAVIVADFSENYCCKHHEEIQAHHFGSSRQQVSLHTVVIYVLAENNKKIESYCTVSSNTNHQPSAIWAHLEPVLKDIQDKYPDITTIHFFTDGPFSQYRQKQNFYLSSTTTFDYGFNAMTWSFFEAGHGKGPADGIGGYLKRSADDLVARGEDISSTDRFYEVLKDVSKIKLFMISSADIENVSKAIPSKIQPLAGTKHVHQVFTTVRGELKYRNLSCFCNRGFCECLSPKEYRPLVPVMKTGLRNRSATDNIVHDTESEATETNNFSTENAHDDAEILQLSTTTNNFDINASAGNSIWTSDDEQVLSNYKAPQGKSPLKEIELLELSKAHNKKWYDVVYPESSDSEDASLSQPGTSAKDKENRGVRLGDYLLVNVSSTKGKYFKYVCVVKELLDDGDITVTFLRYIKNKNTFIMDENDIADIDYTDIVKILDEPTIIAKRGVQYYIFKHEVEVSK